MKQNIKCSGDISGVAQQHTTVSIELSGFLSIYSSRRTYACVHITQLLHHRWRFSKCLSLRLGFPGGSVVKNSPANAGDTGSIPRLGRSLEGGNGNLHQYFCLENSMDRGAWQAIVHGVERIRHDLATQPLPLPWGHLAHLKPVNFYLTLLFKLTVTEFLFFLNI